VGAYQTFHVAVALEGTGWHPAAWREPDARPDALLTAGYWSDLVVEAERGLVDLVTIEDGLTLQSDDDFTADRRTDHVRGRLDAVLIAARVAPRTRYIGLVPTVVVTHTEPFHISKAIATLDFVSSGRAGVRVQLAAQDEAARHFGRREIPAITRDNLTDPVTAAVIGELFDEAADYVEVIRRLWDSWEDDAEIRDVATGRFIDRDRLHNIDFTGKWFSVKGPSITPRPPQGQPVVAALGHGDAAYRLIAGSADVGFVTPRDRAEAAILVETIAGLRPAGQPPARVFADLVVFLADTTAAAVRRRTRLDDLAGYEYCSDATIFTGSTGELADLISDWADAGVAGVRLRPATIPHDLHQITTGLIPELQRRGLHRTAYESDTLRGLLRLHRPANRYTAV